MIQKVVFKCLHSLHIYHISQLVWNEVHVSE